MYMIEFSEDKVSELATKVGKALRLMGEIMTCVDSMQNDSSSEYSERNMNYPSDRYYNERNRMDGRYYNERHMGSGRYR